MSEEVLPDPVCWYEGMLLSPQHFQQNHIYWESQLKRYIVNTNAYFWGISEFRFDEGRLLEGELDILRLVAIMPDGLHIDVDAERGDRLRLSLAESEDIGETGRVKIHLVVPIRVPGSASDNSMIQRYLSKDSDGVVDDNTGKDERIIQRLKPRLALQATESVGREYVSLPLLVICKPDRGSYQVGRYYPPLIAIAATEYLGKDALQRRCRKLAFDVRKKARQLAGLSEDGDERLGSIAAAKHRSWIQALVQELAHVELLADCATTMPLQLYQALAKMLGSISQLSADGIPPKLPAYDHSQSLLGFDRAIAYINEQVGSVNLNYTTIVFTEERDGLFTLAFDKAWLAMDLVVELQPDNESNSETMANWFHACCIASISLHPELYKRRILGARAQRINSDEKTGVTPAVGHLLYRIKADKRFIRSGHRLGIRLMDNKLRNAKPKRIMLHLPHQS